MFRAILLIFVAIAGPWVVHLAPTRQRLMALVGFIGVLLMWLVFESWVGKWWFWVALLIGIGSVLFVGGGGGGHQRRPPPRTRRRPTDMTEEIGPVPR
jgi:peptidoglycan/LPS O-acetylase OafA/YrhL